MGSVSFSAPRGARVGPVCTPAVCTPQPLLLLRDVGSGWGSRCAQVLGARRGAGAVAVDPCPAVGWPGWKAASAPFFPCWPGLPHLGGERDHGFHPGTSSGADWTVPSPCFTSPDAPGSVGEGRALPAQLGPWDCPSRTKDSGPACAGDVRLESTTPPSALTRFPGPHLCVTLLDPCVA